VDSTEEGVLAFDTQCRYVLWNPAMERFTGRPKEQVLGSNAFDFYPTLRETGDDRYFYEALQGRGCEVKEQPYRNDRGREVWLEARFFPMRDHQGEVIGGLALLHDVTLRHKTENALRQSGEKFQKIFQEGPIPMLMTENRKIVAVNRALCVMLGYDSHELLGRKVRDFVHPEDKGESDQQGQDAAEGKIPGFRMRKRYLHKDGRVIWGDATVTVLSGEGGSHSGMLSLIENITDRKAAEEALLRSEADLRSVFNSGSQGMVLIGSDGLLRDYNRNAEKILNTVRRASFEKGRHFRDYVPANLLSDYDEKFNLALKGEYVLVERAVLSPSGSETWIEFTYNPVRDESGRVSSVCMTGIPIDERRRAMEALRESEERYRRLVEFSPEAVLVHSGGRILYANPACLEGLKASARDTLVGRPILDFIHPDYRELTLTRVNHILEKGESNEWVEQKMVGLDGETIEVETKGTPIQYQGRPAVLTMIRDIRDRKKNQATLLRYERLAAVGQVITAIAHEIRTPLSVVGATAQFLREKAEEKNEWKEETETLYAQTERLRRFFDDILDYSREMSIRKDLFRPREVMEQALELARSQARHHPGVKILWDWDEKTPALIADSLRLEQVLVNLFLNSFQALKEGGTVNLASRLLPDWLQLEIRVDGPGISEAILPRLFEPFFTTKKQGTGLGLPISQKIAEAHGGRIEIRVLKPHGTCCTLFLPLTEK
jgi:two-component system sporulation sensor kinase A